MTNLKTLAKDLGITERQAGSRLDDMFRVYQLDKKYFKLVEVSKEFDRSPYKFSKLGYEIIKILIKSIDKYPLVKSKDKIRYKEDRERVKDRISISMIQDYYKLLLDSIEEVKNEKLRIDIKKSPIYSKTIAEVAIIDLINDKISHFLAASNSVSEPIRMGLWEKLYKEIDNLIFNSYEYTYKRKLEYKAKREAIEEEYKRNMGLFQYDEEYIEFYKRDIEKLLKEDEEDSNSNQPETYGGQLIRELELEEIIPSINGDKLINELKELELGPKEDSICSNQQKVFEYQLTRELEILAREYNEEKNYPSLDKFLIGILIVDAYKNHFKANYYNTSFRIEEDEYAPYKVSEIKEFIEKDEKEKKMKKISKEERSLVQDITGFSYKELKKKHKKYEEINLNIKKKDLENYFSNLELTEFKVKKLLEVNNKEDANKISLFDLDLIWNQVSKIHNDLTSLQDYLENVLNHPSINIPEEERISYQFVLDEVVNKTINKIQSSINPSYKMSKEEEEFYSKYLDFYDETKEQSQYFKPKVQAFSISPSIEALEMKLPEE